MAMANALANAIRGVARRARSGPDWERRFGASRVAGTRSWLGSSGAKIGSDDSLPDTAVIDLTRRRDELNARVAELQWDLGGLVYEMAIRDHMQVDVLVRRAAMLQDADAELGEVERILRMEKTGTAGSCGSCGALHSRGAVYCWQCGGPLLEHVSSDSIAAP